jgi:DNA-binding NarL/FixJ family response regulator
MKTLVLIDDHAMLRRGLSSWLAEDGQWRVLGEAASLEEAAALFERLAAAGLPDLALLDIELNTPGCPGSWGLDLIQPLKARYGKKAPPVLVYSVYDDYVHLKAALRAGAKGYVCKSQDIGELRAAMDQLAAGGVWFSPGHAFRMAEVSDLVLGLTKRERQIFELVQRRSSNREIAVELGVSHRTVENNLSVLYDKTATKNRKELEQL